MFNKGGPDRNFHSLRGARIILFIFGLGILSSLWQACDGGTIVANPLRHNAVFFSEFETQKLGDPGTDFFVRDVRFCIGEFAAIGPNNEKYRIQSFNDHVILNAGGTLVGFLEEENLPDGEYQAHIKFVQRCAAGYSVYVENSQGVFQTPTPIGLTLTLERIGLTEKIHVWRIPIQEQINQLATVTKNEEIPCKLDPSLPGCM